MRAIFLALWLAVSSASPPESSLNATACLPSCYCNVTSQVYRCFRSGLTALPEDMFSGWSGLQTIDLSENILKSPLPPNLFAGLTSLKSLTLSASNVTAFPAGLFRDLSALQSLNIAFNPCPNLPAGLLSIPSLASLDMIGMELNFSALPAGVFSGLPGLLSLNLAANPTAVLPPGLLSIPTLTTLDLSDMRLRNLDVRATLGALPALTTLSLNRVSENTTCPDFSVLASLSPRLSTIRASHWLTSIPPRSFSGLNLTSLLLLSSFLPTLKNYTFSGLTVGTVALESSSIVALEPAAFAGLTASYLDLNYNSIGTRGVPHGGIALPGVSALGLRSGGFDSEVFAKPFFADARSLTSLDMQGFEGGDANPTIFGVLPTRAFASAPCLQTLNLWYCGIAGFEDGAFEGIPELSSLNLGYNSLAAFPPGLFDPLPALATLIARNNAISAIDLFAENALLAHLDLGNNRIAGLPDGFFKAHNLLGNFGLPYQGWPGTLKLANGTFIGINATGELRGMVQLYLFANGISSYDGFTSEADIKAAMCDEARATPGNCVVYVK